MRRIFIISLAGMMLFIGVGRVFADDPCMESKQIWRDRLQYDADMRKKRGAMKRELAALRIQDAELDEAMGRLQGMILATDNDAKEKDLWNEFDAVNEKREALGKKRQDAWNDYYQVTTERTIVKTEMKERELEKRYECVVNDTLNEKLDDLIRALEKTGYSAADVAELKRLIAKRDTWLKTVDAAYRAYRGEIDDLDEKIAKVSTEQDELVKRESLLDEEEDRLYDELYEAFDLWKVKLKEYSAEIAKTSEELFRYTEVLK